MKRICLVLAFAVFVGLKVHGQKMSALMLKQRASDSILNSKINEFVLNPLPFFVGGFEIGYGVYVTEKFNFKAIGGYYYSENAGSYGGGYSNMEGIRVELQYLSVKPVKSDTRYYFGGYLAYKQMSILKENSNSPNVNEKLKASAGSVGIIFGIRNYFSESFFIDFHLGGGPTISIDDTNAEEAHIPVVNPYKRSINPRAGLSIGILF